MGFYQEIIHICYFLKKSCHFKNFETSISTLFYLRFDEICFFLFEEKTIRTFV